MSKVVEFVFDFGSPNAYLSYKVLRPILQRTGATLEVIPCLLGGIFTAFQAYEYSHAAFEYSGNVYGAVFFMATGFHGFHVIVGTIFLFVCLMRARAGDFTADQHLGFEAAAWYWHFVDVVWLFLFAAVYIWAA